MAKCPMRGSNSRPWAHKTHAMANLANGARARRRFLRRSELKPQPDSDVFCLFLQDKTNRVRAARLLARRVLDHSGQLERNGAYA